MSFTQTMKEAASHLGLSNLLISQEGTCRIVFNDTQAIDIEESKEFEGMMHAYSVVGKIPRGNRETVFGMLLEANFLGQGTGTASLSVDQGAGEILLYQMISYSLCTPSQLAELIKALGQLATEWTQALSSIDTSHGQQTAPGKVAEFNIADTVNAIKV
ncbi:type III secretion system chaperone [Pleionea sp. CnH1-48]|uniref:type III secretion system chaperone n=1 Tax=Pleionea sp. CnH1-48 TaxID=2954494 RepID=UPI002097796C|nr:type III secretion system chaperone [Pleionea sp. CnH1-48]MCO7226980.1 type III secretion system chaperone [Pleionea sp. CnH1-48]